MKTDVKRIVESQGAPNENDLWLNGTTLKKYQNGEWVEVASGGSGDSSVAQLQADWNQTDDIKADYIKNKPEIPSVLVVEGRSYEGNFVVLDSETTTWQEAADHFVNGGRVLFKCYGTGSGTSNTVRYFREVAEVDLSEMMLTTSSGTVWYENY